MMPIITFECLGEQSSGSWTREASGDRMISLLFTDPLTDKSVGSNHPKRAIKHLVAIEYKAKSLHRYWVEDIFYCTLQ